MFCEACALAERLSTLITCKGVLSPVEGLMFGEGGTTDEGLPAVPTFIWPHSKVGPLMAAELCTLAKSFPALVTLEGLHPGMDPLVLSQVFAAAEGLPTFVTFKVLLANPWMHSLPWVLVQGLPALVMSPLFSSVNTQVAS